MRRILLGFPIALMGCNAIAPAYDAAADTRVTSAYQQISGVLAKAELGALASRSSYPGEIDTYADVLAKLETAKLTTQGDAPANAKLPAAKANTLLVGLIQGCIDEVKSFSKLHKDFGIPADAGATQPVRVACDETVKAVGARSPALGG